MAAKRVLSRAVPQSTPIGTSIVQRRTGHSRLLSKAAEGHTPVTLKIRGSELAFRGKMLDVDPKTDGIQLVFELLEKNDQGEPECESLKDLFVDPGARECIVLVYLQGRSILGVNAEPVEIHDRRIVFAVPPKIFKIQRRKDVRFTIPQAYEFTVEFESLEQPRTRVRKRLIDLSEGGLSFFILSPREAGFFKTGLIIKDCFIQLQHQRIPVMLRVCNQAIYDRGSKGDGNKIGVEFEQISPDDKAYIAQFVYSHAQHLFY